MPFSIRTLKRIYNRLEKKSDRQFVRTVFLGYYCFLALTICLSVCLSVCMSVNLSVCESVNQSVCLSSEHLMCLKFCLFLSCPLFKHVVCLSVCQTKKKLFGTSTSFSYKQRKEGNKNKSKAKEMKQGNKVTVKL